MTTYNVSGTATTSGGSGSQNVTTADSVVVTVTNAVSGSMSISTSGCTSNKSSMPSGSNATITFSSTGNYSVTFTHATSGKEPDVYIFQLTGSISAAATQYSVTSGTISLGGIQTFFGDTGSIALGDLYKGGSLVPNISQNSGVPSSGTIDIADLYGVYKNN